MDDIKAKQQLLEKIKESTNILVTVSNNPSVDALSAAIGLTVLLDKMDKHATAVFSGVVPPAIAFLEPEKILDDTTDSLRDFIIALDKEKADHLRYKVEGDSVKIFITPYKTTITSDDLQFSQGDYNVELVIALGVDDQDHLDKALESHGQILHDATVATITAGDETSTLGGIDWHDDQASSLSEMLAGLSEALKGDKKKPLIDAQIATAYLTGIVAQTERFSNRNTTSSAMTVASQLMAAGADQQLIATKLEESQDIPEEEPVNVPEESVDEVSTDDQVGADGTLKIGKHKDDADSEIAEKIVEEQPPFETLEQLDKRVKEEEQKQATQAAEAALDHTANAVADGIYAPTPTSEPVVVSEPVPSVTEPDAEEPTLGGTLNATTEQAADDARREEENDQNKTILTHSYLQPSTDGPQTPGSEAVNTTSDDAGSAYVLDGGTPTIDVPPVSPAQPQPAPADLGLPMPPPIPDFSQGVPVLEGPYAPPAPGPAPQPERLGDIFAPEASAAPVPQPVVEAPVDLAGPYAPPVTPPAPVSNDPGQFKIPGQQ